MPQVTGRVFISLGGMRLRSKEGAELDTGGLKREAVASDSGIDGHTESFVPPGVTFKISHTAATKLTDIHAFKGNMTFETDTGVVFTLSDAFSKTPPKLVKGEVSCDFGAIECIEG
jgi:hypothetical protein